MKKKRENNCVCVKVFKFEILCKDCLFSIEQITRDLKKINVIAMSQNVEKTVFSENYYKSANRTMNMNMPIV